MIRRLFTLTILVLHAALVGCSSSMVPDDTDASVGTDGFVEHDAGASDEDAAANDAASERDAAESVDSGPPDEDGDGVPDAEDCDPADGAIGRTAARACTTACGEGEEACTDGAWGACDAPTDCLCDTEGMTRVSPCARCGMQGERCTDGVWTATGSCLGSGECEAGETEVEMDPSMCLHRERLCDSGCGWGDWVYFEGPGQCTRGARRCTGPLGNREQICTETCIWEYTGDLC